MPYAALGIVVGRLGEFLDGHGQGLASALPWATQYANQFAATPDFGVARHPAQLYDALVALGLFALIKLLPSSAPHGARLATFLVRLRPRAPPHWTGAPRSGIPVRAADRTAASPYERGIWRRLRVACRAANVCDPPVQLRRQRNT